MSDDKIKFKKSRKSYLGLDKTRLPVPSEAPVTVRDAKQLTVKVTRRGGKKMGFTQPKLAKTPEVATSTKAQRQAVPTDMMGKYQDYKQSVWNENVQLEQEHTDVFGDHAYMYPEELQRKDEDTFDLWYKKERLVDQTLPDIYAEPRKWKGRTQAQESHLADREERSAARDKYEEIYGQPASYEDYKNLNLSGNKGLREDDDQIIEQRKFDNFKSILTRKAGRNLTDEEIYAARSKFDLAIVAPNQDTLLVEQTATGKDDSEYVYGVSESDAVGVSGQAEFEKALYAADPVVAAGVVASLQGKYSVGQYEPYRDVQKMLNSLDVDEINLDRIRTVEGVRPAATFDSAKKVSKFLKSFSYNEDKSVGERLSGSNLYADDINYTSRTFGSEAMQGPDIFGKNISSYTPTLENVTHKGSDKLEEAIGFFRGLVDTALVDSLEDDSRKVLGDQYLHTILDRAMNTPVSGESMAWLPFPNESGQFGLTNTKAFASGPKGTDQTRSKFVRENPELFVQHVTGSKVSVQGKDRTYQVSKYSSQTLVPEVQDEVDAHFAGEGTTHPGALKYLRGYPSLTATFLPRQDITGSSFEDKETYTRQRKKDAAQLRLDIIKHRKTILSQTLTVNDEDYGNKHRRSGYYKDEGRDRRNQYNEDALNDIGMPDTYLTAGRSESGEMIAGSEFEKSPYAEALPQSSGGLVSGGFLEQYDFSNLFNYTSGFVGPMPEREPALYGAVGAGSTSAGWRSGGGSMYASGQETVDTANDIEIINPIHSTGGVTLEGFPSGSFNLDYMPEFEGPTPVLNDRDRYLHRISTEKPPEQGSPEWHALRRGVLTASKIKDTKTDKGQGSAARDLYLETQGINKPNHGNAISQLGNDMERRAKDMFLSYYQQEFGEKLTWEESFFETKKGLEGYGASPDGHLFDSKGNSHGLLEIKTKGNETLSASLDEHYEQMQLQLLITGEDKVEFFAVNRENPNDIVHETVYPDLKVQEQLMQRGDAVLARMKTYSSPEEVYAEKEEELIMRNRVKSTRKGSSKARSHKQGQQEPFKLRSGGDEPIIAYSPKRDYIKGDPDRPLTGKEREAAARRITGMEPGDKEFEASLDRINKMEGVREELKPDFQGERKFTTEEQAKEAANARDAADAQEEAAEANQQAANEQLEAAQEMGEAAREAASSTRDMASAAREAGGVLGDLAGAILGTTDQIMDKERLASESGLSIGKSVGMQRMLTEDGGMSIKGAQSVIVGSGRLTQQIRKDPGSVGTFARDLGVAGNRSNDAGVAAASAAYDPTEFMDMDNEARLPYVMSLVNMAQTKEGAMLIASTFNLDDLATASGRVSGEGLSGAYNERAAANMESGRGAFKGSREVFNLEEDAMEGMLNAAAEEMGADNVGKTGAGAAIASRLINSSSTNAMSGMASRRAARLNKKANKRQQQAGKDTKAGQISQASRDFDVRSGGRPKASTLAKVGGVLLAGGLAYSAFSGDEDDELEGKIDKGNVYTGSLDRSGGTVTSIPSDGIDKAMPDTSIPSPESLNNPFTVKLDSKVNVEVNNTKEGTETNVNNNGEISRDQHNNFGD